MQKYPHIYERCTVTLTPELKANPNLYYFEKDYRDLTYMGLCPSYFLAFLSEVKQKDSGKICSYSNVSKMYDAVKFGSCTVNRLLSMDFYSQVDGFPTPLEAGNIKINLTPQPTQQPTRCSCSKHNNTAAAATTRMLPSQQKQ